MKFALTVLLLITTCNFVAAQTYDTVPPYKKSNAIPTFSILQTDSTWFNNLMLPNDKPVVFVYFSPECGHCALTAHDYVKDMNKMKDIFFVWVSYLSLDEIRTFAQDYRLLKFKNVRVGRDPKYYIPSFFKVKHTPFIAVYDKNKKFLAAYDGGTDTKTIINLLEK